MRVPKSTIPITDFMTKKTVDKIKAEGIREMLNNCNYIDSEDYHGNAIDVESIKTWADKLEANDEKI